MKNLILLLAGLFIINLTAKSWEIANLQISKNVHSNETEMVESITTLQVSAGQLSTILSAEQLAGITNLTLTGTIDARDFKTIRDLMPVLANLDLTGATIAAYTGTDGTVDGTITYPANSVPESALKSKTSIKSVVLANSITRISYESFLSCGSLESVILPLNLISIDGRAFGWCKITSISLPSTLQSIGNYAFANNDIPIVNIPPSVLSIGSGVFYQNRNLTEINVSPSNQNYISIDGVLFNKNHSELIHYPNGKTNTNYSLPDGVQKIQSRSFDGGNSNLRNLTIPEGVIEIGFWAFANLWNLESIDIPSSIIIISDGAFIGQHNNLQSIKIRKNIPVTISSDAFGDVNKSTCVLYVPFGTKTDYQDANVWKDFQNIVEMAEIKKTYIPDNNFEQALIGLGYDSGPLDDYVPTANISGLTSLDVSDKGISDLTGIQDFISLQSLNCGINSLTTIDLSKNLSLTVVLFYNNLLASLDVSQNSLLQQMYGNNNYITTLDLSQNPDLNTLDFGNNKLTSLDLSNNPLLFILNCSYNQIPSIDLSNNTNLVQIGVSGNPISTLDISNNKNLRWFYSSGTNLTEIDCSQHPALQSIDCADNTHLTFLNLQNANNAILKNIFVLRNPNLYCIQVDDPITALTYSNWMIDAHTSYSSDCSQMPVVTYPSHADIVLNNSQTYNITWSGFTGTRVIIELLKDNTVTSTIVASTPNDGTHLWTIPAGIESGEDFRIMITSMEDKSVSDISDNFFTIKSLANPLVLVPSEPGLIWNNSKSYTITWSGFPGSKVRIELLKGNTVRSTIAASTANDGSHPWTIAKNLESGSDYKIKINSVENRSVTDISDFDFAIQPSTVSPGKKSAEIEVTNLTDQEKTLLVYPNPFTYKVNFEITLQKPASVVLEIYTITGLKLATLFDGKVDASMQTRFDYKPKKIQAQILLYKLRIDDEVKTGKLIYKP